MNLLLPLLSLATTLPLTTANSDLDPPPPSANVPVTFNYISPDPISSPGSTQPETVGNQLMPPLRPILRTNSTTITTPPPPSNILLRSRSRSRRRSNAGAHANKDKSEAIDQGWPTAECHVMLFDRADFKGQSRYYPFYFYKMVDAKCYHLGDAWNDRAASIKVWGAEDCECVLHEHTCGSRIDREQKRIREPGISDLSTVYFDGMATALSCHVPRVE